MSDSVAGVAKALELVGRRGSAAQLCVIHGGEVVIDQAFNCHKNQLFWIFSASKPYAAVLIHLLAERGQLDLDEPVAGYWPQYGRNGKEKITVRQVLQHRSGVPTGGSAAGDLLVMTDWERSVRRLANAKPRFEPGSVPAYQFLNYGYALGELARRVTGRTIVDLLKAEVLAPIGAENTYLGLPDEEWPRHVPFRGAPPVNAVLNRRSTRRAVIPAAGVSTTARDLASFYPALLRGQLLGRQALATATTPSSDGEIDRYARKPIRWSQGFQLGGPRWVAGAISPLGALSSPNTFGHNGSNSCIGWADPDRDLAFAYLTDHIPGPGHHAAVADALLSPGALHTPRQRG